MTGTVNAGGRFPPRQNDRTYAMLAKPVSSACNLRCGYCYYLGKLLSSLNKFSEFIFFPEHVNNKPQKQLPQVSYLVTEQLVFVTCINCT